LIAPRWERRGLLAARPVLVVGMAPSRAGHDLEADGGPTLGRLAAYCGRTPEELSLAFDFVNLLPDWPEEAGAGSKWDARPDPSSWEVGQRAALLWADLWERPRHAVVLLGDWVAGAARAWGWRIPADRLGSAAGPAGARLAWSPHPAGTNMWWNDPAHRAAGEAFWRDLSDGAARLLPRAPQKVKLHERSRWLLDLIDRLGPSAGWPEACVDWPWTEPPGRPQALLRGQSVPAAHVVLDACEGRRPDLRHQALHSCDRGEHCVNAAHLRWGLEIENRLDQSARARGDIGRVGLEKAREVRRELEELSERHGVPLDAVARIAGGRTWTDDKWETS
jgi:hypothetical protein